ncbi:hypothetical protein ASG94_03320 [Nocardioides sp. Soil805]|nr:hypothetical protein ASG94_03320 [Nocardioides sp. Soil805]
MEEPIATSHDAGVDHEQVGGLVRRVRRVLDCSQRGLAGRLGVDRSKVARWETGALAMGVADLESVLALAGFRLVVVDSEGAVVGTMREDAVRDRAGRRYPAHADPRPGGWWTPRDSWLTARELDEERRSAALGDPRIFYGLGWLRDLERHFYGVPYDHPTLADVVAILRVQDAEHPRAC